MAKAKRISFGMSVVLVLLMSMSLTVFAATTSFSGSLPARQGDTEISKVARENENTTKKYFTITISSLGTGTDKVRAWAETGAGINASSPYNQVGVTTTNVYYNTDSVPAKGTNVTLNLDNPVYMTTTVSVSGSWTPN